MKPKGQVARSTLPSDDPSAVHEDRTSVPTLTVLYHPDTTRIGERALLHALAAGSAVELSRHNPLFAQPRDREPASVPSGEGRRPDAARPLLDRHVSAGDPIRLKPTGAGGVQLDPGKATPVLLGGQRAESPVSFAQDAIDRGVVLTVAHRIVLLLHFVSPHQRAVLGPLPGFEQTGILGESDAVQRLIAEVQSVADRDTLVLVRGESGSGKERVAHALHRLSARRGGPFLTVNLGAIPPEVASGELFGTTRGGFTGAVNKAGYFERAAGGTLFLDEVGEISGGIQAALLRALDTGEIQRVGEEASLKRRKPDVRIVVATDADLEKKIANQDFRQPLLNRLMRFPIMVPPLRDRRDDIGRLLIVFLREELEKIGEAERIAPVGDEEKPWLPASIVALFAEHGWPGNVRELRHDVEQLVIASRGRPHAVLRPEQAAKLQAPQNSPAPPPAPRAPAPPAQSSPTAGPAGRKPSEYTEEKIAGVLGETRGNVTQAAGLLGVSRTALLAAIQRSDRLKGALGEARGRASPASR